MGNFFATQLTPLEMMEQYRSLIQKTVRELEREIERLKQNETEARIEIKKTARNGQLAVAKIMAKDLVRTRNSIAKLYEVKANLQGVYTRIQLMQSTAAMSEAMRGATRAMYMMNRQVNLPALQNILKQFEKEGDMFDMKQELMDDTIDTVMRQEGDDAQEDEVINQVLDEIGINLASDLDSVPPYGEANSSKTSVKNNNNV